MSIVDVILDSEDCLDNKCSDVTSDNSDRCYRPCPHTHDDLYPRKDEVVPNTALIAALPTNIGSNNTILVSNGSFIGWQPWSGGGTGPQGPQGPTGAMGMMGPIGPQGIRGLQGLQGSAGPIGPQGSMGAIGLQGQQGPQGAIGPIGPQGLRGDIGLQGQPGLRGPQGFQGPTGPQGANGAPGVEGPQGPQGDEGVIGPLGPQGAQGSQGGNGWTMIPSIATDNERRVLRIADYVGGVGSKPVTGLYIGSSGPTPDITLAVNIRGATGLGDMQKDLYDPTNKGLDVYNRLNHTGLQSIDTIIDLQTQLDAKELRANKASNFSLINNTAYPSTLAVSNYIEFKKNELQRYNNIRVLDSSITMTESEEFNLLIADINRTINIVDDTTASIPIGFKVFIIVDHGVNLDINVQAGVTFNHDSGAGSVTISNYKYSILIKTDTDTWYMF